MDLDWQTRSFDELSNRSLYALLKLRLDVFSIEQECIYQDLDNLDQNALHMLAWHGEKLLAYQRLLPPGLDYQESSIGRIVVHPDARGRKIGEDLVRRGMNHAAQLWPDHDIRINAQAYLKKFYGEMGFEAVSEEYIYDSVPHLQMLYRRSN